MSWINVESHLAVKPCKTVLFRSRPVAFLRMLLSASLESNHVETIFKSNHAEISRIKYVPHLDVYFVLETTFYNKTIPCNKTYDFQPKYGT